ncbi:MAG: ABC transporter permease subunit [Chloroflexi bacterium]|nr:ABC transporter permease subunit [Chloroflexota bacterium]
MLTVILHTMRRFRGQIIGWGIGLALYAAFLSSFYDTIAKQSEQFEKLLQNYPQEIFAFFGGTTNLVTPEGYLTLEFFSYMPIIIGIFAVLAGSGLLASDEENGTMDLVLAHPISRSGLFLGRLLALLVATMAILAVNWLGFLVAMNWSSLDIGLVEMARPFLSLFAILMLFGSLALFLSMVLPSRRSAAMISGVLMVASFFITSLARLDKSLEDIARLSPMNYYQSGEAIKVLNNDWFLGLLAAAGVFVLASWWLFQRRDIRVGGEGGWRLPSFTSRLRFGPFPKTRAT